ncbi:MAG: HIT domain-containing protein [Lentisphaeria bacterium]|jgi:ATP adenylyltransferase|nr:HIT domain-containing protein [Lentisphaeria bacterium]NLZ59084.1 HIT domain-containing protein [Lentisphaerota bacterium]
MPEANNIEAQRPLWAPWRIDYIRADKPEGCFFCEKGGRDCRKDHVVHKGKRCFVLLNDFPYNCGHLLVAPYRHLADLTLLEPEELLELGQLLVKAETVLRETMRPDGFNIGFNIGRAAGAGVKDHVHGHVVPRWVGDTNFMPVLNASHCIPEALDASAELLRQAWE